jgi:uncharacterized protein (DUF983 family)
LHFFSRLLNCIQNFWHIDDRYDIKAIVRHDGYYNRDMQLWSLLRLRCPICGVGKLFHGYFDSPERCPNCGYYFIRETGYFLPHVVIGYGVTVLLALGSWPVMKYVLGIESPTITLGVMIGVALFFGTWFVRYSKAIWLALDLTIHPPAEEDFKSRGRN